MKRAKKYRAVYYIGAEFETAKERLSWEFSAPSDSDALKLATKKAQAICLPLKGLKRAEVDA